MKLKSFNVGRGKTKIRVFNIRKRKNDKGYIYTMDFKLVNKPSVKKRNQTIYAKNIKDVKKNLRSFTAEKRKRFMTPLKR